MIELEGLRKVFSTPNGSVTAVEGLDLTVADGEFVTIVGPSGCGKTTTLRCVAGLERPSSGRIKIDGNDVTDLPGNKRNISMMFQNIALYPHMTVRKNIGYPLKVAKVSPEERNKEIEKAAKIMQIPELLSKYPSEVSGGQRQRAALARTIVQEPSAFLLDEPLSDLDAKLKVEIRQEIQRIHQEIKRSTIYVTHDQEEALTMSDRIVVMNNGTPEQVGTPDALYENPRNKFIANFIGNPSMNFVNGTVENVDDNILQIHSKSHQFSSSIHSKLDSFNDSEVTIGFRPTKVNIDGEDQGDSFKGEITLFERIGDEYLATIQISEKEIQATTNNKEFSTGDSVSASVDPENIYLFSNNTGEMILDNDKKARSQMVES